MSEIDFVLPWIDGDDPHLQQLRRQYLTPSLNLQDEAASARFRDMGTLRYALRSITYHCPWYHKIYLIVKSLPPSWIKSDHPRIEIIKESDLFKDKSHLPVFNPTAVEMNLKNLKGLSETFVYLNDDFFIWRPIPPERFFVDGMPVDFFAHSPIPRNIFFELIKKRDTWIYSIVNTLKLLNSHLAPIHMEPRFLYHPTYSFLDKMNNFLFQNFFRKVIWITHWHLPQPLLKKTLLEVNQFFEPYLMETSKHRFRSKNDLNQYIYRYWQLLTQQFYPYRHNDGYVINIRSYRHLHQAMTHLQNNKSLNFVCLNDHPQLSENEYKKTVKTLHDFLKKQFPQKAEFEQ